MRRSLALALLLGSVLIAVAAGCGGEETVTPAPETVVGTLPQPAATPNLPKGDPTAGKQVFASAGCTSCHTLKDAGSSGAVGPNLDETKPPLERVIDRVTNGKGAMPPFKDSLSGRQIADVAAYVVQATGG